MGYSQTAARCSNLVEPEGIHFGSHLPDLFLDLVNFPLSVRLLPFTCGGVIAEGAEAFDFSEVVKG